MNRASQRIVAFVQCFDFLEIFVGLTMGTALVSAIWSVAWEWLVG